MTIGSATEQREVAPVETPPVLRTHRRLPTHFFVGMILLYGVVLGTYLLSRSPLHDARPNVRTFGPAVAGVSFYVAANLFLLILGRGRVSRWVVLVCMAAALVLTVALCVTLRAHLLVPLVSPHAAWLSGPLDVVANAMEAIFAPKGVFIETARFASMPLIEEAVKLSPVFVLVALGRIKTAHAAMLCGAMSGLTFGIVEAISYGFLVYPTQSPVTTYLTRFFVMSPLHGIWDALAGGGVFFLGGLWRQNSQRVHGFGAYAAAFACAMMFHVTHNALQAVIGPGMQIITVFFLLSPLYVMARVARKRAAAEGMPDVGQLVGDLHMLTLSLAVFFMAGAFVFSWVLNLPHAP